MLRGILQECAVDCNLNRNANINISKKKIKYVAADGKIVTKMLGYEPYSRECDYMAECNYPCEWKTQKDMKINYDTYNISFARDDIDRAKIIIKGLYKTNYVYNIDQIRKKVIKSIKKYG